MGERKDTAKRKIREFGDELCRKSLAEVIQAEKNLPDLIGQFRRSSPCNKDKYWYQRKLKEQINRAAACASQRANDNQPTQPAPVAAVPAVRAQKPDQAAQNSAAVKAQAAKSEPGIWKTIWDNVVDIGKGLSYINHPIISSAKEFTAEVAEKIVREAFGCKDEGKLKAVRASAKVFIGTIGHKLTLNPVGVANEIVQFLDNMHEIVASNAPDLADHFGNVSADHPFRDLKAGTESYKQASAAIREAKSAAKEEAKEFAKKFAERAHMVGEVREELSPGQKPRKKEDRDHRGVSFGDPLLM